ncbi:MAG: M23 family metallopeptidase [Clostridia bacterium]|nr:M23 family metallopeptidase [Clostridia bacterium]
MKKNLLKRTLALALTLMAVLSFVTIPSSAADVHDILFDWQYYYVANPDVARAFGRNPSALRNHYNNHGKAEGRAPSEFFDPKVYVGLYPDLRAAFGTNYKAAYNHFVSCGINEGRQGSAKFSVSVYKANYADLRRAFGNDNLAYFNHYKQYGKNEGRSAVKPITSAPAKQQTVTVTVKPNASSNSSESFWQSPLKSYKITQSFGKSGHLGVDMKSDNTAVYAAASGTVVATGLNGTGTNASSTKSPKGNGYYVVIKHTFNNKTVYSMYGHLAANSIKVKAGDEVTKTTQIGTMGNTGRSTGPHLHFAIADTKKNGSYYGYMEDGKDFTAASRKETRSGVTFYNPIAAINNGTLG